MSLKFEIETWVAALDAYKQQDYELAIDLFGRVEPNSKMLTNIGLIYAALGEHELAVENFRTATTLDPYLAVAYFQAGVSNFIMGQFEQAYEDFEDALDHLRGNQAINYEQLGLKFILFAPEVIFNKGLTLLRLGKREEGMQFLHTSQMEKVTPEHDVIDEAIEDRGEGYTVFSISLGVLYEPSASKVKNSKARDWLGKAKLITTETTSDINNEFAGRKQRSQSEAAVPPAPPKETAEPMRDTSALARSRSATVPSKISDPEMKPKPLTRGATTGSPRVTFNDRPNPSLKPATAVSTLPSPLSQGGRSIASLKSANSNPFEYDTQPRPKVTISRSPSNSSKSLSSVNADDEDDPNVDVVDPTPAGGIRGGKGLTQLYDGLLEAYAPGKASPPPTGPLPPVPYSAPRVVINRSDSRRVAHDGEHMHGNNPRRRPTLRGAYGGTTRASAAVSRYEEVSADWNEYDVYEREPSFTKIRIKLYYQDDVRGMAIPPSMPFDDFVERVCAKFGLAFGDLSMKFEDEDGGKVSIRDEGDYEMAIETARDNAKERSEGKLSIWCENF